MSGILVLVTAAALGVEVGWQPLPEGGHEYTIQIEPQLVDLLKRGNDEIYSEVPPGIEVRRYRVIFGTGPLPREAGPTQSPPSEPVAEGFGTPPAAAGGAIGAGPADRAADAGDRYGSPPAPEPSPFGAPPSEAEEQFGAPPATSGEAAADDGGMAPAFGTPPEDDWSTGDLPPTPSETAAEEETPDTIEPAEPEGPSMSDARPPGRLPRDAAAQGPIQAAYDERPGDATVETQKPELDGEPAPARPWIVLLGTMILLCCSVSANVYLGWIAWNARTRYRTAVAKLRPAG